MWEYDAGYFPSFWQFFLVALAKPGGFLYNSKKHIYLLVTNEEECVMDSLRNGEQHSVEQGWKWILVRVCASALSLGVFTAIVSQ